MNESPNGMMRRIDGFMKGSFNSAKNFILPEEIKVDVEDLGDQYNIKADLPGVEKGNISLTLENGTLDITVERKESTETTNDEKTFIHRERFYGSHSRQIYLANVSPEEKANAKLENGILTITIPKSEKKILEGNIEIS